MWVVRHMEWFIDWCDRALLIYWKKYFLCIWIIIFHHHNFEKQNHIFYDSLLTNTKARYFWNYIESACILQKFSVFEFYMKNIKRIENKMQIKSGILFRLRIVKRKTVPIFPLKTSKNFPILYHLYAVP